MPNAATDGSLLSHVQSGDSSVITTFIFLVSLSVDLLTPGDRTVATGGHAFEVDDACTAHSSVITSPLLQYDIILVSLSHSSSSGKDESLSLGWKWKWCTEAL